MNQELSDYEVGIIYQRGMPISSNFQSNSNRYSGATFDHLFTDSSNHSWFGHTRDYIINRTLLITELTNELVFDFSCNDIIINLDVTPKLYPPGGDFDWKSLETALFNLGSVLMKFIPFRTSWKCYRSRKRSY